LWITCCCSGIDKWLFDTSDHTSDIYMILVSRKVFAHVAVLKYSPQPVNQISVAASFKRCHTDNVAAYIANNAAIWLIFDLYIFDFNQFCEMIVLSEMHNYLTSMIACEVGQIDKYCPLEQHLSIG